jgi:hypothetical protein
MGESEAYNSTDAESSALVMEKLVRSVLAGNKGIYAKVISGEPLTASERSIVGGAMQDAIYRGKILRPGFQFVQGYLVYVN